MKKSFCILFMCIFICIFLHGCSKDNEKNKALCLVSGCYNEVANNNTAYCKKHIGTKANELYKQYVDNNIKLTDIEISKCRTVVDNYCKKLINTQSNIRSIYIIDDTPKTSAFYIMYKCNVYRDDSDVNLATIYVEMLDDGTFKVKELEYDK